MSEPNLKKDLKDIGYAILIFLAIQGVLYAVLGVFPPYRAVSSGSMEPTYHVGDVVFIKKVDTRTLEVGDVIVFDSSAGGIPIVHRIVSIVEENGILYFVTKGDNNAFRDSYYSPLKGVPEYKVIGTPVFRIPKVGWVSIFVRKFL